MRLDGIPALDLWDLIISVLGKTTQDHCRTGRPVVCSSERGQGDGVPKAGAQQAAAEIPSDDILEGLYKLRIRQSEKLKTVLELYNMEKAGPDYE